MDTTAWSLLHNLVRLPSAGVLQHQQHPIKTSVAHSDGIIIPEISTGNFILGLIGHECAEKQQQPVCSVIRAALQPQQLLKQTESGHRSDWEDYKLPVNSFARIKDHRGAVHPQTFSTAGGERQSWWTGHTGCCGGVGPWGEPAMPGSVSQLEREQIITV